MEKFKQTFLQHQEKVNRLEEAVKRIEGNVTSCKPLQLVSVDKEFGEYPLYQDVDTFRISVSPAGNRHNAKGQMVEHFQYSCVNHPPTGSPAAQMNVLTDIPPEEFEEYYMKGKSPEDPFHTKLWEFSVLATNTKFNPAGQFHCWRTYVTIDFAHEYSIQPHVSFYITPFNYEEKGVNSITISELTTKKVTFEVLYGKGRQVGLPYNQNLTDKFMLHYSVSGPINTVSANLLE